MQLNNSFTVPANPEMAWKVLLDVPRIAPCMLGAELTEVIGENNAYKGNARLRVGPVNLTFSGEAEITRLDEAARTATVHARGNDTRGGVRQRPMSSLYSSRMAARPVSISPPN